MTPQPFFIPLSIQLRRIARQNERDICRQYGAVHAFVSHWLQLAEHRRSGSNMPAARAGEEVLQEARAAIADKGPSRKAA